MHRSSCLLGLVFVTMSIAAFPQGDDPVRVPAGFQATRVYTVPKNQGSWVSLTNANKGRLIACNQRGRLYRITPGLEPKARDPEAKPRDPETKVEELKTDVGNAQGLLYAFDSLYVIKID